jgi:hypothetical protein
VAGLLPLSLQTALKWRGRQTRIALHSYWEAYDMLKHVLSILWRQDHMYRLVYNDAKFCCILTLHVWPNPSTTGPSVTVIISTHHTSDLPYFRPFWSSLQLPVTVHYWLSIYRLSKLPVWRSNHAFIRQTADSGPTLTLGLRSVLKWKPCIHLQDWRRVTSTIFKTVVSICSDARTSFFLTE